MSPPRSPAPWLLGILAAGYYVHTRQRRAPRAVLDDDNPVPRPEPPRHTVVVTPAHAAIAARNATLTYRPLGQPHTPYPDWVRALKGKSGVYVIRQRTTDDAATPAVLYVGESHTGRLYETLTRHFQAWRRYKGYWRGQYAEGHDPGLTYPRARIEVATRITTPAAAIDAEARLIARLNPRDNLRGQEDEVPF